MAKIKLNARDHIVEVLDRAASTGSTKTWVEVDELINFVPNLSENEEKTETTGFKDEGNYREEKMQKGAALEITAHRVVDKETGEPDPGQALIEAWHEDLGPESEGTIRFRNKRVERWTEWDCTVTVGEGGGENNDKDKLEAAFTRCGPSRKTDLLGEPIVDAPAGGGA